MKIEIPQIFWHGNRDRIMSIDFYPNTNFLVTCGAESEDKMWIKVLFNNYFISLKIKIKIALGNRRTGKNYKLCELY